MERIRNLFWYIKDVVNWRRKYISSALRTVKYAPKDVSLWERLRFFLPSRRVLLPIPNRFMKRWAERFALGLRLISSNAQEEIYEKDGILYLIPKEGGFLGELYSLFPRINFLSQYEEPPVIVGEGDIVIDCGANIGVASLLFAKKAGKEGKVIAIEPEERNYEVLRKSSQLNKDKTAPVIPLRVAVYKEDGHLKLYVSKSPASHTLYKNIEHEAIRESLTGAMEEVKAVRIDTIVEELGLGRVDFIKMDIEGAEVDALLGAERTITQFKPKLAICTNHRPTDPIEISQILQKYNPNYKFKEIERGEKVLYAWDET
ncbi:MAG: FkbM family methyltransferase [bacterium]